MNIKQESQKNPNINWGQPEEFSVYEQIEDAEGKYIVCSKKKRIKITPMYTVHNTKMMRFFIKLNFKNISQ